MSTSRALYYGPVILMVLLCFFFALNCGGTPEQTSTDAQADDTMEVPPPTAQPEPAPDTGDEVSSQGGTVPESEVGDTDEPEADGAPVEEENIASKKPVDAESKAETESTDYESESNALFSQLSRYKYERLEPTEEMIEKAVVGFYKIEGAEFLVDKSSAYKSERVEIYDLWYKLPEDTDYSTAMEKYAAGLDGGFTKQEMETDNGYATYFVTQSEEQ